MTVTLVDDATVIAHLDAELAIRAIEEALDEYRRGTLHAPARLKSPLGQGSLVFTSGAFSQGYGFRAYDTFPARSGEQLTVVWDQNGRLSGVVVGQELGRRRTGALGAAAAARLLPVDEGLSVGVIGAGAQAFAQLWAILRVNSIKDVRSYRRDPAANLAFAQKVQDELSIKSQAVTSAEAASREVNLLIIATGASEPVIEDSWISDSCTIFTLGPKRRDACELPESLFDRAQLITSDSVAQIVAEGDESILPANRVVPLAHLKPLTAKPDPSGWTAYEPASASVAHPLGLRLYLSTGLAGTELFVAQSLIKKLQTASS
ncbi:hypothetical protein [Ferrimicrobium sp.]|uniref:hypothetical protein n=1 Tax=Ferrimicrobium sp. TaxID=2926050 RepID=UPI00263358CD|nr:hypothetical protein [Ferrimicrobium sp.]